MDCEKIGMVHDEQSHKGGRQAPTVLSGRWIRRSFRRIDAGRARSEVSSPNVGTENI